MRRVRLCAGLAAVLSIAGGVWGAAPAPPAGPIAGAPATPAQVAAVAVPPAAVAVMPQSPVLAAPVVDPVVVRLPEVTAAHEERIAELEARLAEMELLLPQPGQLVSSKEEKPEEKEEKKEWYEIGSDSTITASFKNGIEFSSKNKDFRFHVGGRTQLDGVWLHAQPGALDGAGGVGAADAVDFRRARLRCDGRFYEFLDFVMEYDFANSGNAGPFPTPTENSIIHVTAPSELYWNLRELPWVGNFKFGQFKEPIGLEHYASSRFLDFMERSFNQDAFTGPFNNGFTPGLMFWNWTEDERATWSIGVFKNTQNVFSFGVGDGEYATTGRLTWLPWYDEASEGRRMLHLGVSGSYRSNDQDRLRFRSRASLRNGPGALNPILADTGFFSSAHQALFGGEAAWVYGPWLVQAEWMGSTADQVIGNKAPFVGVPLGTIFVHGYYAEVLYFLTGEHRVYERHESRFGRIVPHSNFFFVRTPHGNCLSWGAWQVGARYSKLDLNDGGINGGVIQDVTIGLNWFWNPNMKIQFNYVWTHRDAPAPFTGGDINGFGTRIAFDF
jgi:phosphate-selective porin OprO and OprP